MTEATTQGGTLRLVATATGSRFAALDHAQTWTGTERGNSWGMCQPMLGRVAQVGVRVNLKDKSAIHCDLPISVLVYAKTFLINWRGLNCAPSLSRNSHRVAFPSLAQSRRPVGCSSRSIGHHFPAARHCAERGAFIRVNRPDCTPPVRQSLPYQQLVKCLADRRHVSNLSSSVAFAGFQPSEAPNGRAHNSRADLQKSEGELPYVRC